MCTENEQKQKAEFLVSQAPFIGIDLIMTIMVIYPVSAN
jgi:hypothetical protein